MAISPQAHRGAALGDRHPGHNWEWANAAARTAMVTADFEGDHQLNAQGLQLDDGTYWRLTAYTPAVTWEQVGNPDVVTTGDLALVVADIADDIAAEAAARAAADALLAPKASPVLTGVPEAPTAASGTANAQIANTAFVQNAITSTLVVAIGVLAFWDDFMYPSQLTGSNLTSWATGKGWKDIGGVVEISYTQVKQDFSAQVDGVNIASVPATADWAYVATCIAGDQLNVQTDFANQVDGVDITTLPTDTLWAYIGKCVAGDCTGAFTNFTPLTDGATYATLVPVDATSWNYNAAVIDTQNVGVRTDFGGLTSGSSYSSLAPVDASTWNYNAAVIAL